MFGKFPVDSDFVESYLNSFILQAYFFNHEKGHAKEDVNQVTRDSLIYAQCVNLNEQVNKLADCSERKENVDKFIEKNPSIAALKTSAVEKCSKELEEAHSLRFSQFREDNAYKRTLFSFKAMEKEENLKKCIDNLL
jgi:hypothetical protein